MVSSIVDLANLLAKCRCVHLLFHINYLCPYVEPTLPKLLAPLLPIDVAAGEYKFEGILDSRLGIVWFTLSNALFTLCLIQRGNFLSINPIV